VPSRAAKKTERPNEENYMLRWAAIFFVIAIIAGIFGFVGVAGAAASIAKVLFFLFIVGFVIMLLIGLSVGKRL
jgi:uncharacterized membrane protein YtjA (UPF0391 family)